MSHQKASVAEFYNGKTILITGGTGFIGKCLIEKLLRSCSGIKRIFILLRGKRGKSVHERMESFKKEVIFQQLPGTALDKLVGIESDLSSGCISVPREGTLHLQSSTKTLLDFASSLKNLEIFVHVSTAYSKCDNSKIIEEKIYPPYMDWRYAIRMAEQIDGEILDSAHARWSTDVANTYVFTKNIAEYMVYEHKDKLPVLIYRPSVVVPAEREPIPGFIDNFNGPTSIFLSASIGINRVLYSPKNGEINMIPVDMVIRGLIIAAVKNANEKNSASVYNAASIKVKKTIDLVETGKKVVEEVPANVMLWRPDGKVTSCIYDFYSIVIFTQILPAILVDGVLKLYKKQPMLLKYQRIIMNAQVSLQYFISNYWTIENEKFMNLNNFLAKSELKEFEIKELIPGTAEYLKLSMMGSRRHLMHWPDKTLENAKKLYRRMVLLDQVVKYAVLAIFIYFIYNKFFC
ncbi:fatty acyl-CoA reductase 1-like [Culicoides brevitarsis]|uniref:fatty acyl-CoA reductase 1-like n=1 Tax=Culicoides brevitarsis TaxID=469753 RepID=UPI00307B7521